MWIWLQFSQLNVNDISTVMNLVLLRGENGAHTARHGFDPSLESVSLWGSGCNFHPF